MDARRAEPEDLPPLPLRHLRDLDLRTAVEGRPHVSAASGVVRRGDFVYVIGDDLLLLAQFVLSEGRGGSLHRVLDDEIDGDKPDLEALTALPPAEDHPHGGLLGLGSGSKRSRDRGFFWAFTSEGSLEGDPVVIDVQPAYDLLRGELPRLNVEGAAVLGDAVWLFHRGGDDRGENAVVEVSLESVVASLHGDRRLDCEEVVGLRRYELGQLDGIDLTFSDATPLADHVVVFTASAEDPDDGSIRGSVVGTIDGEGQVRRLRTIDRRWKVEGVHASIDTGVLDLLFVCDQDDPDVPSPLLSASMPLEGRLELRRGH